MHDLVHTNFLPSFLIPAEETKIIYNDIFIYSLSKITHKGSWAHSSLVRRWDKDLWGYGSSSIPYWRICMQESPFPILPGYQPAGIMSSVSIVSRIKLSTCLFASCLIIKIWTFQLMIISKYLHVNLSKVLVVKKKRKEKKLI